MHGQAQKFEGNQNRRICQVNGKDIGREMVKSGWALDYKHFSKGKYSSEERAARENRRGIWAGEFENPYQWRKDNKRY